MLDILGWFSAFTAHCLAYVPSDVYSGKMKCSKANTYCLVVLHINWLTLPETAE